MKEVEDNFFFKCKHYRFLEIFFFAANNGHGTWNAHQVELALWTHFVANELDPDLLNAIPQANGKSSVTHQNGEVKNVTNVSFLSLY